MYPTALRRRHEVPYPRRTVLVLRRRVVTLPVALDPEAVAVALVTGDHEAFWLDSARLDPTTGSVSYIGAAAPGTRRVVRRGPTDPPALDRLRAATAAVTVTGDPCPVAFGGGYVGYLGYEARDECGHPVRPRRASAVPASAWISADRFVAVDHGAGLTHVVELDGDGDGTGAWARRTAALLAGGAPAGAPPDRRPASPASVERALLTTRERYRADVRRCLEHLRDGDSYEICLTTRARTPATEPALDSYRRLRRVSPAPYAAFLRVAGIEVASASLERFLRVGPGPGAAVESRPVKGTAARAATPAGDADVIEALRSDAKTRAENLMIVDLVRNDLNRVCVPGTVRTPRLMAVETYASVHQMVSTVAGTLAAGHDAVSAVRACFPAGSMTGAPKRRTMEIIDELEGRPRGVYSGALGWVGYDGAADLSVVIRTAVRHGGWWEVGAGGAVVADSDPDAEYDEMLLKAAGPLQVLLPAEGDRLEAVGQVAVHR